MSIASERNGDVVAGDEDEEDEEKERKSRRCAGASATATRCFSLARAKGSEMKGESRITARESGVYVFITGETAIARGTDRGRDREKRQEKRPLDTLDSTSSDEPSERERSGERVPAARTAPRECDEERPISFRCGEESATGIG